MDIKGKLYGALVEKHSEIRNAYQGYVNADPERHKRHRIKSWLLLAILNIQYHTFGMVWDGARPTEKKAKQLSYPESNRQMNVQDLVAYLSEFDVISFDVFDTLLFRACEKPTNVFSILGNRLGVVNFTNIRIDAEKYARKYTDKAYSEVNIQDIYDWVNRICGVEVDEGIRAEIQTEKDLCFANPYMKQVVDALLEKGKKFIAVSNMYLPKEVIRDLIEGCGYTGFSNDKIFVSCELLCSKHQGRLQSKVWDIIGRNKSVIHVGDNYNADFVGSRMMGWKAYYYKNVNEYGKNYRAQKADSIELAVYNGIVNAKLHNGLEAYSPYYEIGYAYAGILACNYCKWINQYAKDNHIDLLLFSSRDMYIIHKIYNAFFKEYDNEYMLISRFASLRFSFECFAGYFIDSHVQARANIKKLSISEMLQELDVSILSKYLNEYNLSEEMLFTRDEYPSIKKCIFDHKAELIKAFEEERKAALFYYKSLIKNRKRIAVVDLGWQGTNALCLKYLLEKDDPSIHVNSLLMCSMGRTYVNESISAGVSDAFCFSPQKNTNFNRHFSYHDLGRFLCELSFSSNEDSLKCFGFSKDGRVTPEFLVHETRNKEQLNKLHQGIWDYVTDYMNLGLHPDEILPSGYESLLPFVKLCESKYFVSSILKENEVNPWIGVPTNKNASNISKNVR